ncbi:hypothetical protein [Streptomyces erythrochromogenes]|uniref:hypothetical protein n=1 Tax=Streptomyces erythrochromogenes TaxID=285574 RepID=UPI00386F3E59|nr:hypothetical protein OG364_00175 [Streptomyces erythrochromogenes]WST98490.1 hypothetical protein OG364_41360 [Streptomyces erythrochromogenes]
MHPCAPFGHSDPFDSWALRWAVHARNVSPGDVVAGLLLDLAADPRSVYLAPSVAFHRTYVTSTAIRIPNGNRSTISMPCPTRRGHAGHRQHGR